MWIMRVIELDSVPARAGTETEIMCVLSQLRECLAGPRRPGEGIEDEAQGIVDVQETASG
jgi:hypothetical protein